MKNTHHLMLKGRMRQKSLTIDDLACALRCHRNTVSNWLTCAVPWTYDAILTVCDICDIPVTDIAIYFERSGRK